MITFTSAHLKEGLFRIYERARKADWRPETDFDWERPSPLSPDMQRIAWTVASQASYAEQLGLLASARLLGQTDDGPARLCLATAVSDEARHSETFARYALRRGGKVLPPDASMQTLRQGLESVDDFLGLFFVHTALEWLAADEFSLLARLFQGDVLGDMYLRVRSDELRHVGMGMLYLRWRLKDSSRAGWDATPYEQLALRLSGFDDRFFAQLGALLHRPPSAVRHWFMSRHQARVRHLLGGRPPRAQHTPAGATCEGSPSGDDAAT
uniref:Ferritin-like domain-containing protein n=1 Tax=Corallococcus coralloides TaxID=184914 RepID=A0A3S7UYT4_CORCK|nr:hypothetical protein [Corallococcus coralloides]